MSSFGQGSAFDIFKMTFTGFKGVIGVETRLEPKNSLIEKPPVEEELVDPLIPLTVTVLCVYSGSEYLVCVSE